jgi:hypothetical protein
MQRLEATEAVSSMNHETAQMITTRCPFLDINLGSVTEFVDCVFGESKYHHRVFAVIQPEAVVLDVQKTPGHERHQLQVGWRHSRLFEEFDGRDSLAAVDTASLDDLPLQE